MPKLIGLDIGEKRVGVAAGESETRIAFPRGVIERYPAERFLAQVGELVKMENAGGIVLGIPLGEENEETPRAKEIRRLGDEIARRSAARIIFVDEFGSTKEALSKLPTRAARRKKENHDAVAAQIILQRYFDALHDDGF